MQKLKIAINGLGRIGKCIFRAVHELNKKNIEIAAINVRSNIEHCANMLTYDSVHGKFKFDISQSNNTIYCNNQETKLYMSDDLSEVSWNKHNIDFVMECSGAFKSKELSKAHINIGAKRVIISSPAKNVPAIIYGVNHNTIKKEDKIISASSCTTNCLAPTIYALHNSFTIKNAYFTTIHSYTNDQNILDKSHKDIRRARACCMSIIPTTTGAANNIEKIIPVLKNKIQGSSIRVPVPNVSLVDLSFITEKEISLEKINTAFAKASEGYLKDILGVCKEKLVSIDFTHNQHSAIIDHDSTKIINNKFGRVAAWYDNEWSFALRMIDIAENIAKNYTL